METSQIQAATPNNTYGFKIGSQEMAQVKAVDEVSVVVVVVLGISHFHFRFQFTYSSLCDKRPISL